MKRNYYFHKNDSRLIIIFFLAIIFLNVIAILFEKKIIEEISIIVGMFSVFPFYLLHHKKEEQLFDGPQSNRNEENRNFVGAVSYKQISDSSNNAGIIERQQHIDSLKSLINIKRSEGNDKFKGIVLTGDSGSGKSILINLLVKSLTNDGDSVDIYRDYSSELRENIQIVIFDQFEKILNNPDYLSKIIAHSESHHSIYIFSFPQNYITRMKNLFSSQQIEYVLENIHILSLNDDDINDYIDKILVFSKMNPDIIRDYIEYLKNKNNYNKDPKEKFEALLMEMNKNADSKKLCEELVKVMRGEAPLIELELMGYIFSFDNTENKTFSKEYSFINIYLDDWVEKFYHHETAFAILYLLSEFKTFSIDDVKLATFENIKDPRYCYSHQQENHLVNALKNNPFIYIYNGAQTVLLCEPAHQYIAEQFRRYCQSKEIPENLKYYIDHLKKCIESKELESEYSYKKIEENYDNYYRKHIGIKTTLTLMMFCVGLINLLNFNESSEIHYQLIANSVASLPAIYYIYNYCERFFLITNNIMAKFTYSGGSIVIILSYIFLDAWGIFMGFEIILLAISIFISFNKKTYGVANKAFRKDTMIFLFIGLAVTALGVIFYNVFSVIGLHNSQLVWISILGYSNYALFFIYAFLSTLNHIKYSYIIGRIGLSNISKS